MTSLAEENYLKTIYKLHEKKGAMVNTSALAAALAINAASVTDFIKKMAAKKLISYQKSKGVSLTEKGRLIALQIIRRHRLWEVWLVNNLGFKWDEVHEIAEQLEHISSDELVRKLDKHLGFPKSDPHGDLIPDEKGQFAKSSNKPLISCNKGSRLKFNGVTEHGNSFLQYLTKNNIRLGDEIMVETVEEFDNSFQVRINHKNRLHLSKEVVKNLLVVEL